MNDFEAQVKRVLEEIENDVVFRVNFKNVPGLAIEEVLGVIPDDKLANDIIATVRSRLRQNVRDEANYRRQLRELHNELDSTKEHELTHVLHRVREL